MVTRAPLVGVIERPSRDVRRDHPRCEYVVELTPGRRWILSCRVEGGRDVGWCEHLLTLSCDERTDIRDDSMCCGVLDNPAAGLLPLRINRHDIELGPVVGLVTRLIAIVPG